VEIGQPTGKDEPMATAPLDALRASADRLVALVEPLTPNQLRLSAYPTEWTIAGVLSHLGSGAVIMRLRLDATLTGGDAGIDVMQPVWDEWNAKNPDDQAADALRADRALVERLGSVTSDERTAFHLSMGPFDLDFDGFVRLRLNEHALHSWDIATTLDPAATIPDDATELVVDTLGLVAGFAGKPTGTDRTIVVRTTTPARQFAITLRSDGVTFGSADPDRAADLELPAEALVRLVYGRLDPDHTPTLDGSPTDLEELRRAFPGI
jgi:uncharacterized protein (TIGR03083 family)